MSPTETTKKMILEAAIEQKRDEEEKLGEKNHKPSSGIAE